MHFIILLLSHILSLSLFLPLSSFFLALSRSLPLYFFTSYISVSHGLSAHTQTYITYNLLLRDGIVACSHSDSSFCSNDDFGSPRATSSIVAWNQTVSWERFFFFFYVNVNFETDRRERFFYISQQFMNFLSNRFAKLCNVWHQKTFNKIDSGKSKIYENWKFVKSINKMENLNTKDSAISRLYESKIFCN